MEQGTLAFEDLTATVLRFPCTHQQIHLERPQRRMVPGGAWTGEGESRERDLACPDCGAVVGVCSSRVPTDWVT